MGSVFSKKKSVKKLFSGLPLTAVSEGEEKAWSSAHLDLEEEKKIRAEQYNKIAQQHTPPSHHHQQHLVEAPVPISHEENHDDVEEKQDYEDEAKHSYMEETKPEVQQTQSNEEEEYKEDNTFVFEEKENETDSESDEKVEVIVVDTPTDLDVETKEQSVEIPVDPLQEGGYLVFSTTSDGCMFLVFSRTKVENALAYFRATKPIPNFKFQQNCGRVELIRKLANNKQGYFHGYADFLKAAHEFNADIYIIQKVARVYYQNGSTVIEAPFQEFFSIKPAQQIAAIPPGNMDFQGVKSISPERFVNTGNKYGKVIKF